jgi:homoserine acetyltransferase
MGHNYIGEFLDTNKYRVICTSFLGSPHGATSCESEDPTRSTPGNKVVYGPNFPQITPGDMAFCHHLLLAVAKTFLTFDIEDPRNISPSSDLNFCVRISET